jgi:tripartite-type tricarboxylate transporter receptor subunit TctC
MGKTVMTRGDLFRRLLPLIALAAIGINGTASAQTYPNRPIRMVVPYAAGGSVDIIARVIAAKLSDNLGQPVIVENRTGAGGNAGADVVAKSPPDGYTMLLAAAGLAISGALYKNLPFDPVKDFAPVTQVIESAFVLLESPKVPAANLRDLIALAKAKPGAMNYGSSGVGSSLHLSTEIFKNSAGIDVVHIPYRGDAPLYAALIAGDIQMAMSPLSSGLAQVQGNQMRGLAVTGPRRAPQLPDVPTFKESGVAGLETSSWQSLLMPANTPREIVLRVQQEVSKVVHLPDVVARFQALGGAEPVGSTPEEFGAVFRADVEQAKRIIEKAGIPRVE